MNVEELEKEITELTNKLREQKPSLYKHITENTATLPDKGNDDFSDALVKYKDYLKELLAQ